MRLFDSHCHIDDAAFEEDRDEVLARAREVGVSDVLVPAVAADGWDHLLEVSAAHHGLCPALGIHPMYIDGHGEGELARLERLLSEHPVAAVGECGLDYYIPDPPKARQRELFEAQLAIADRHGLPVVVHARRAEEEAWLMVRDHPGVSGVFHSFSGSYEQARRLLDHGFLLGFGGPVTYERAKRLRRLVARLPLDGLLLETDAPDQPDAQWRGRRNEPMRIASVLEVFCQLRRESKELIAARTHANAARLFGRQDRSDNALG